METPKMTPEQAAELDKAIAQANKEISEAYGYSVFKGPPGNGSLYYPGLYSTGDTGYSDGSSTQQIKNMKEADKAYREIGIVRNVLDIMTDFASEGLNIVHPVPSQERFYRAWAKKVFLQDVVRQLLQGMYKWGNVGVFKFWGKIRPTTKREMLAKSVELMKEGKDKEAIKAFFREDTKYGKSRIPVRYSCLPPFRIRIQGSLLFNDRTYWFQMPSADREKLSNSIQRTEMEQRLIDEMPEDLKAIVDKDGLVLLPRENFTMFHYKRDCARLWADPLILPIMDDLRYKLLLRAMDRSIADSIINPITIFKLGDTPNGFPPTKEAMQNLANLLKLPTRTKQLVWGDLIEVEQKVIDAKEVLTADKYTEVNDAILSGLGISAVLVNGGAMTGGTSSGGFAGAFLSVRTLLERLEDGRYEVMKFLEAEFNDVRKAMGWSVNPTILWDQMSLRDETAEKRIIIDLLDRKVISAETALHALGFDKSVEVQRKKFEAKETDKIGIVQSVGPFEQAVQVHKGEDPASRQQDLQEQNLPHEQEMQKKEMELKKHDMIQKRKQMKQRQSGGPRRGPGKPRGAPQNGYKSNRKSRITASEADYALKTIEKWYKPLYLKSLSKDNLRQLTASEKADYEQMLFAMLCYIDGVSPLTPEYLATVGADAINNELFIEEGILSIFDKLVDEYRIANATEPNTQDIRTLESRALSAFSQDSA